MDAPAKLLPLSQGDPVHVARWQLLGRLGAGGMGVVYLAERDGRRAAVKLIHVGLVNDNTFRTRFRREVATSRSVAGRYVAAVLDADPEGDPPWLATEYVPGPTLGGHVDLYGPLPEEQAVALAAGLLEGLTRIHGAGVVHRDLKPSNVLLTEDGPVIIDFGVAAAADATSLTGTGISIGSAGWMAPEQVIGDPAGPPADVFAWGAVTAFAASGRAPFGTGRPDALAYRIAHGQPDLTGLPASLDRLIHDAMAKDPRDRPTIDQLRTRLSDDSGDDTAVLAAAWAAPTQVLAEVAARTEIVLRSATEPVDPVGRRGRYRLVAGLFVAVGLIAGAVGLYLNAGSPGEQVAASATTEPSRESTTSMETTTTSEVPTTATTTTGPPPTATTTSTQPAPRGVDLAGDTDLDESNWTASSFGAETYQERIFEGPEWQLIADFPVSMNSCNTWQKRLRWRSLGAPLNSGVSYYNPDPTQYPVEVSEEGGPSMEGTMVVGGCEQPAFRTEVGDGLSDVVVEVTAYDPRV